VSILWAENFEVYGGPDTDKLLDGFYADIGGSLWDQATQLVVPSFETQNRRWAHATGRGSFLRRVLGGTFSSLGVAFSFRLPNLPPVSNRQFLMVLRNAANDITARIYLTPTGDVEVRNASDTIIAATTNAPITAGFVYRMQAQFVFGAGTGTVEVRVNGQQDGEQLTPIIGGTSTVVGTALDLPGNVAQLSWGISDSAANQGASAYYKYVVPYSLTGTYNSDWPLITGVATLQINSDTTEDDFTPRPFQMYGAGVLFISNDGTGDLLDCGANAAFQLGDADFTLEGTFRYGGLPSNGNAATLLGVWNASGSRRSYRLVEYAPDVNDGALRFECTTDGTLATLIPIIDVQYPLFVGHEYKVAVCRASGVTRLFIDGQQVGVEAADTNVYFAAGTNAKFTVGGEISGTGTSVLANSSFKGHVDEIRITPGVARYTANYTPATDKFPRTVGGDPDFASVVLLAGFDEGVTDESSFARALTARGNCARQTWADGDALYKTANTLNPDDTRFMEAAFLPSTGVFRLDALPSNDETVTLGATTYTFKTTLTPAANEVLIDTDVEATLENLLNAVNAGPGSGTKYGTGTTQNASAQFTVGPSVGQQLTATANTAGAAGNSIASTDTCADGVWSAATLLGGQDIPDPVEFTIQPLPINATGVRALFLVDRAYLNADTGSAMKSFVVNGDAADGADNGLSTTPTYRGDVIEEDPDTTAGLTPQSVLNGRLRYTRTA